MSNRRQQWLTSLHVPFNIQHFSVFVCIILWSILSTANFNPNLTLIVFYRLLFLYFSIKVIDQWPFGDEDITTEFKTEGNFYWWWRLSGICTFHSLKIEHCSSFHFRPFPPTMRRFYSKSHVSYVDSVFQGSLTDDTDVQVNVNWQLNCHCEVLSLYLYIKPVH